MAHHHDGRGEPSPVLRRPVRGGVRWCERVAPALAKAGHNYTRYYVGDVPPENAWNHSTLEANDAATAWGLPEGSRSSSNRDMIATHPTHT